MNEQVYIMKPGFRSPLGPFRITQLLPNDEFELKDDATQVPYHERLPGMYLKRDPY